MDAAAKPSAAQTQRYQRRRPETTLWYRTVQSHFETWLALTNGPGDESTPAYIEQSFRRYLDCGKNQTLFFTFASSTACGITSDLVAVFWRPSRMAVVPSELERGRCVGSACPEPVEGLLARIYETLPLVCPLCQSPMRIIAFITEGSTVHKILDHHGESTLPPCIAPARGPPLWKLEQAQAHRRMGDDFQWDSAPQAETALEFDQRVAW